MTIKICPRCQQRYTVMKHSGDFVHQCNSGNKTLDKEDVKVVGDWVDYTGSGKAQRVSYQGIINTLQGTDAGLRGEKDEAVSTRGNPLSVYRQRQHEEYIDGDK